jgi:phenylpropionate dioxygenase-like ring-hydroxylating dioxygenase large terminal subunit
MGSYLRNTWYMAAWADEVEADKPLARTLLDEPILFFRTGSGEINALLDRCPHRFSPLSLGIVEGDRVTCRYHGLQFDGSGACVENPHGPLAAGLKVRAYPVVEAYRAIWIWAGDPARADPSTLRDLSFLDDAPETAFNSGYLLGQGHYQLFVDNILDLTHTDFLHPNTLGGGSITRTPAEIEQRPDGVIALSWHPKNEVPTPVLSRRLPEGTRVDSWTEVEWTAPGIMTMSTGAVPTGTPREAGENTQNVHIMTPETQTTTHYFFASTRDFLLDDVAFNEQVRRSRSAIFSTEDAPMIAGQQSRMGDADFWSLRPALLSIDRGAVLARRRMDTMIAAEQP